MQSLNGCSDALLLGRPSRTFVVVVCIDGTWTRRRIQTRTARRYLSNLTPVSLVFVRCGLGTEVQVGAKGQSPA